MNMPAGRELDVLVHQKIFRLECDVTSRFWQDGPLFLEDTFYSTSIAAAWLVVEKLDAFDFELGRVRGEDYWECFIWLEGMEHYGGVSCEAPTAPLAICRSALLAVMDI